ncbi:MAG: glycoside hydrolase family 15 protein [Actinomycetota bacterium]|nr:glycoside hydrolase family 15 protein [Actinomycetota bacterium]
MASIGDHAFLSDCQSAALLDRDGTVVWWPGGTFAGPSAFSRLLDPDAGHFSLRPAVAAETTRRYLPGTLVLETTHVCSEGTLVVRDCLALEYGARGHEIGLNSPQALVRVAEVSKGEVDVEIELVPRLEYGLAIPRLMREDGLVVSLGGPERLFLSGGSQLEVDGGRAHAQVPLQAGQRIAMALHRRAGVTANAPPILDAEAALAGTIAGWRSWSEMHSDYDGPYRDEVLRSALVVQGLTYQPSGAVVAAATTSLPEVTGGAANWDYRFAWLRDASLIARALLEATCSDEAHRYFGWMSRAAVSCRHSEKVQIVFGAGGERNLDEQTLDHLRGFADSRPVRIGNAAWRQSQLDVLGEVLDVAVILGDDLELDDFTAAFLCQLIDRAEQQWRDPDAGVWETRDAGEQHTFSKVMCWVALDRGVQVASRLGDEARSDAWAAARDEVRAVVLAEAWNEDRSAYCGELGGKVLDASVLLLPLVGFLEADDERMRSTIVAIREHLGDDGLIHRREDMPDEGAFLPACFWLAACEALAGDEQAGATFERALGCANDVGLLAEMVDVPTNEALGNVPQALSHVGLVTAANLLGGDRRRDPTVATGGADVDLA